MGEVDAGIEVAVRRRLAGPLGPTGSQPDGQSILPGSAYASDEWFELERQAVFGTRWTWAAYAHQVPNVGDVRPCVVAGRPLLVVHGPDGIHVLHNVCRHRGLVLCDEPVNRQRLRCPYHGWSYGLDGSLQSTPFWDRSATEASLDLMPVRSEVWAGMVFVHLGADPDASPSFAEAFGPLHERWSSLDLTRLAHVETRRWEIEANWKLVVENFLDFYHLPFIHPEVGSAAAALDADDLALADGIIGGVYPRGAAGKASKTGRPLPTFGSDIPQHVRDRQDLFCVFPNTLLFIEPDWMQVIALEPVSAGLTIEHMAVFVDRDAMADELAAARGSLCDVLFGVNDQDMPVLRRLHAAKRSPVADRLHLVEHWDQATAAFQALVRSDVAQLA